MERSTTATTMIPVRYKGGVNMDIRFDEMWRNEECNELVLWFIAPKELMNEYIPDTNYPEMVSTEIQITTPLDKIDANHAAVSISPTRISESGQEDYDWNSIEMDKELIETLLVMADV